MSKWARKRAYSRAVRPCGERVGALVRGRPLAADALLAGVLFVVDQVLEAMPGSPYQHDSWWELLLAVVLFGSLTSRRRWPWLVYLLQLALGSVVYLVSGSNAVHNLALLIALYTVASLSLLPFAVLAGLAAPVTQWSRWSVKMPEFPANLNTWVFVISMSALAVALGQAVRKSRRREARLEQSLGLLAQAHERLAGEVLVVERSRIARELHDIVAHGLGVIAVRAGVARFLAGNGVGESEEAFGVIERAARDALSETRHVLTALRMNHDEAVGTEPMPGLDRLDDLVSEMHASGLMVEVSTEGDRYPLPCGLDLAAYRIVQEALANTLKHAGPVRAQVLLRYKHDRLEITVTNEAEHHAEGRLRLPSSGHGLIGMRERVQLYGGALEAGPTDQGGFRVDAVLPTSDAHKYAPEGDRV